MSVRSHDTELQRFERTYRSAQGDLRRFVARSLALAADVEDVVAETFLIAWRRFADVPPDPEEARRWLFVTARHVAANHRRAEHRRGEVDRQVARERVAPMPSPESTLEPLERWRGLRPADRAVLATALRVGSGRSLAEALGCSPAAAAARIHRARSRLRADLTCDANARAASGTPPERY